MIVVINGNAAHGKDTFVELCDDMAKTCSSIVQTVANISMVDPLRSVIAQLVPEDTQKDEYYRAFMAEVKASWAKYFDGPTQYVLEEIYKLDGAPEPRLIFVHCRELEERERFKELAGNRFVNEKVISLLVDARERCETIVSNKSDAEVFEGDYDFVVDNNGTLDDLKREVLRFHNTYSL